MNRPKLETVHSHPSQSLPEKKESLEISHPLMLVARPLLAVLGVMVVVVEVPLVIATLVVVVVIVVVVTSVVTRVVTRCVTTVLRRSKVLARLGAFK